MRSVLGRNAVTAACILLWLATAAAQNVQYSTAHRDGEQIIRQTVAAVASPRLKAKLAATRVGTAMVAADFDADGYPDLLSGYTTSAGGVLLLQRGARAAHAPGPDEWAMKAAGQLVSPYKEKAEAIDVPVSPDFLLAGDISGHGNVDLATAAKGDSSVYVLLSHGDGTFSDPAAVALSGQVSSLALWRGPGGTNLLVAAVCGASGCGLQFIDNSGKTAAFVATPAGATSIETGWVDYGAVEDLALVAGGRPMVLEGDTALSASPTLEQLPISGVTALALGRYVMDSRGMEQMAVLGSDATLHVFTRAGVEDSIHTVKSAHKGGVTPAELKAHGRATRVKYTGKTWYEAENVPNVGSGGAAIMVRAHLLGSGLDDLAVIGGARYVTVAHRLSQANGRTVTTPVVVEDSTASPVLAALPARVGADARQGVVMLGRSVAPLVITQPTIYKTYTVTTINDGNDVLTTANRCISGSGLTCTLRDAVNLSNIDEPHNLTAGTTDVINVPAGIYVLSVNNPTPGTTTPATYDKLGSINYHLEADGPVVINGAGSGTGSGATIINANSLDQAITFNGGAYYATSDTAYKSFIEDDFLTNLTIENAVNNNSFSNASCPNGYCNVIGGGVYYLSEGTTSANFVMNNVTVLNSTDDTQANGAFGGGGGVFSELDLANAAGTLVSGPIDIENSTISGNTDHSDYGGGGVEVFYMPAIVNNTAITSNTSTNWVGGGMAQYIDGATATMFTISNSSFTSNSAPTDDGGGLFNSGAMLVMTGTTFTSNSSIGYGAGLVTTQSGTKSITGSTFTLNSLTAASTSPGGNYTQDGAGVCIFGENSSAPTQIAVNYNRFYGNKTTVTGTYPAATGLATGCDVGGSTSYSNVNENYNWWGCNGLASGTGCDTAHAGNTGHPSNTLAYYTSLVLNLSASTINNGSAITATASLGQGSDGSVYTAAADTAYLATPIHAFTLTDTGAVTYTPSAIAFSSSAAPSTSFAAATVTGTTNTTGTGTATVTVDGTTVTKTYTIVNPPNLTVSTGGTQYLRPSSTGNTYPLTVSNTGGTATSGTVTVADTLPAGFTATAMSGTGWTCTVASATCTRSDALGAGSSYPVITLTFSIASGDVGTYTNSVSTSGGGEVSTGDDTATQTTYVEIPPTITESFSPTQIAEGATSAVTFTLTNPGANTTALMLVAFSDALPTNLFVAAPVTVTQSGCNSGNVGATAGGSSITASNVTLNVGGTCIITVNVTSNNPDSYPNPTSTVTASNSNAGTAATATLTVTVQPTRLVYTNAPDTPITAGGNSGVIQVALEDAAGNVATNNSTTVVTLTVTATGYTTSTYTATVTNGVANFNAVSLTLAGTYTYTASATGLTNGASTETVNPGAFAALTVAGPTLFTAPGQTGSLVVTAVDTYGNAVPGFTGTVTLTSNDPTAALGSPYTYTASDAGSHVFPYSFGTAGTTRTLTATTTGSTITQSGIVVNDCILFINTNGTLSRLTDAGVATSPAGGYTGGGSPSSDIAVDSDGNIWSVNPTTNVLAEFSKAGTALSGSGFTGGGINAPKAVAIDGLGYVWVVNGNNTVSVFTYLGAPVSSGAQPVTGGTGLTDIAIDLSGNLWIAGGTSGTVTEIIGGAAPTSTLAVGVTNATTGTRP